MERLDKRDNFKSKFGFILACIGSSVGMGNIWLFPYRVTDLGGAAFLIPYFIFVIGIGYVGVVAEMSFGRYTGSGPLSAFKKVFDTKGKKGGTIVGCIPVIGSLGIALGYTIVIGWILRFLIGSITGDVLKGGAGEVFGKLASTMGSLPYHIAAIVITFLVMSLGISKGIEKINKVMMPLFFFMFVILAVRVVTLPGAGAGYEYLFNPKWESLLNIKTWIFALGQAFFSLSLAGSGTVVYGSYLNKNEDIPNNAKYVAIFDTLAAILAAIVIVPAVFVYGIETTAGPSLLFITMPHVFESMPAGQLFAIIFFVAVLFAGLTSLVNLYESAVEMMEDRFKMKRHMAAIVIGIVGILGGLALEDGNLLGTWMDMVSIYFIPVGALLASIVFFWMLDKKAAIDEISRGHDGNDFGSVFHTYGKYIFVGVTFVVCVLSIIYQGIG